MSVWIAASASEKLVYSFGRFFFHVNHLFIPLLVLVVCLRFFRLAIRFRSRWERMLLASRFSVRLSWQAPLSAHFLIAPKADCFESVADFRVEKGKETVWRPLLVAVVAAHLEMSPWRF